MSWWNGARWNRSKVLPRSFRALALALALAPALGLASSCAEDQGAASEPQTPVRPHRTDADAAFWLERDAEWPMPAPLAGVSSYELPRDEDGWIARCVPKLRSPLGVEPLRYTKELLGEMGPRALAALSREVAALSIRRDTEGLSALANVIGALAHHSPAETWKTLLPALDHPSPLIRREALRGLRGSSESALVENLASRLKEPQRLGRGRILSGQILGALALAAGPTGGPASNLTRVAYELEDAHVFHVEAGDDELQRYVDVLVSTKHPRVAGVLFELASDLEHATLHRDVVEHSVLLGDAEAALRILRVIARDLKPDDPVRPLLWPLLRRALATLGDAEAIAHLERLLESSKEKDRVVAIQGLGCAGRIDVALRRMCEDEVAEVRAASANALSFAIRHRRGLFPPDEWPAQPLRDAATPEIEAALEKALADPHPLVREEAARVAAMIGADRLFEPLLEQLRSEDSLVRSEALRIVVAPRVRWKPAARVLLDVLDRVEVSSRAEWLQAAVLIATPAEHARLLAILERDDLWNQAPAGDIAARYAGDLGRDVVPDLMALYRRASSPSVKARAAHALTSALVGDSATRLADPPRFAAPLSEGARFLVEVALDDPDLPVLLRQKILFDAPLYGGRAIAPLLKERFEGVPLPPRERLWTLRILWQYF